jgi:hypothetical protein
MRFFFFYILWLTSITLRAQYFDPLKPDYERLNTLVVKLLNEKRFKKNKSTLVVNSSLQKTALFYTNVFVLRKFENNTVNKTRFRKNFKKLCRANGFYSKLIDFTINKISALHYFGKDYYYSKEDSTSDLHLYYGKKPGRKEMSAENFKSVPLPSYSYEKLAQLIADKFIQDQGNFKTLNNAFDQIGLSCVVEPRTLGGHSLPQIKAILIVGGRLICL